MSLQAVTVCRDHTDRIGLRGEMKRREFLAQLAAGMATAGFLLPGSARAESVNVGIVPVGKRGRVLADDLVGILAGTPRVHADVIDVSTAPEVRQRFDGVVVVGCLGGRTGLSDAANCGQIVCLSPGTATAVLLWPMEFEGYRRRASAHIAAGRIQLHGARIVPVTVAVPAYLTLDEARKYRERALLDRSLQEIKRLCN